MMVYMFYQWIYHIILIILDRGKSMIPSSQLHYRELVRRENFESDHEPKEDKTRHVFELARKKILDPTFSFPTKTEEDKKFAKEAEKIYSYAKTLEIKNMTYEQIEERFMGSLVSPETMTISFPFIMSGSSEQEIDAAYLEDDELIPMLKKDAVMVQDYFVAKIKKEPTKRLKLEIVRQKKMPQNFDPEIRIERIYNDYILCWVKRSSHQTKMEVRFTVEDSNEAYELNIQFPKTEDVGVIVKARASYDFIKKSQIYQSILEEVLVLSLYDNVPNQQILKVIQKEKDVLFQVKQVEISNIKDAIEGAANKNLFYEVLSRLTSESPSKKNNQSVRFDILAISSVRKIDIDDSQLAEAIVKRLINYFLENSKNPSENCVDLINLYKSIQKEIIRHGLQEILFDLINDLILKNIEIIKQIHNNNIKDYLANVISKVCKKKESKFLGLIQTFCYFYDINKKSSANLAQEFINQIEIQDVQSLDERNQNFSEHRIRFNQIVSHNEFLLEKLTPDLFLKYLKICKHLVSIRSFQEILTSAEHQIKMKKFLSTFLTIKENKTSHSSLSIVRLIHTEPLFIHLIEEDIITSLKKKAGLFLKDKQFKTQKLLEEFNEEIILTAIDRKILDSGLENQFLVIVKKRSTRQETFRIIEKGLTRQFLEDTSNEEIYEKIVCALIENFKKKPETKYYWTYEDTFWHMNFERHEFITEKFLESVLISIKSLNKFQQEQEYDNILTLINERAKNEQKENLRILIFKESIDLNQKEIFSNIKTDPIYLKIFQKMIEKRDPRADKIKEKIKAIGRSITRCEESYASLKKLSHNLATDKYAIRFKTLFSDEVYRCLIDSMSEVEKKIEHLHLILKYLASLEKKEADPVDINKKKAQIEQKIKHLQTENLSEAMADGLDPKFPKILLYMYNMEEFSKGMDFSKMALDRILQKSEKRIKEILEQIKLMTDTLLKQNTFSYEVYNQYELHRLGKAQIHEILFIIYGSRQTVEKVLDKMSQSLELIKRAHFFGEIGRAISKMCTEDQQIIDSEGMKIILLFEGYHKMIVNKNIMINSLAYPQSEKKIVNFIKKEFGATIEYKHELYSVFTDVSEIKQDLNTVIKNYNSLAALLGIILIASNRDTLKKLPTFKKYFNDMKDFLQENYNEKVLIDEQDIELCEKITLFYEKEIDNKIKNLKNLKVLFKSLMDKDKTFVYNLKRVILNIEEYETCKQMMVNIHHAETTSIKSILSKSQFEVTIYHAKHEANFQFSINIDRRVKLISVLDLQKCKDQAMIMLAKSQQSKNGSNQNMMKERDSEEINIKVQAQAFLKLYNAIKEIIEVEKQLLSYGYILFENYIEKVPIKDGNLNYINEYFKKRNEIKKEWIQYIENLYAFSEKATMLRGKKLKDFYNMLTDDKKKDAHKFRIIAPVNFIQKFKPKAQTRDPKEIINQFFKELNEVNKREDKKAEDRDIYYLELHTFSEKNYDYTYSIGLIDKDKINRLEEDSILSCSKETTQTDVHAFVQRSIRNPDKEYILMGYEKLPISLQDIIIKKLTEQQEKNSCKAKMCLVSNSTTEKLYRAALNMTLKRNMENKVEKEDKEKYNDFLKSRLVGDTYGKVKFYESTWSGLGKTFTIEQEIKNNFGSRPIYFPISGRTSSEKLFERVSNISKAIGNDKIAIIIQLYEILNSDIVNDFLKQLILWRSFSYQSEFCCFQKSMPIYIELQQSYENIKEACPFLRLKQPFPTCFINISNFEISRIQIENPEEVNTLNYILYHLKAYDNKSIDKSDLDDWQAYKDKNPVDIKERLLPQHRELFQKYFYDIAFKYAKNISYYHFKYWTKMFYDSCVAFSQSFQIKKTTLDYLYRGVKAFEEKFKIQELRSTFFWQLLKNSIEFLCYSNIHTNAQNSEFKQKLKQIPFFIIPYANKSWFSFVYRKVQDIPPVIKLFLVSQDPKFVKNPKKFEKEENMAELFEDHELEKLQNKSRQVFEEKVTSILKEISGSLRYEVSKYPQYTINLDNFMKICIIAYRMRANIPLVIQGEAGVGKTALLRYLIQNVFGYLFLSYTINAGLSEEKIILKIEEIKEKYDLFRDDEENKGKKVCVFFDEFNTLPELGYIKQLIMEKKFMGQEREFMNNLIPFAACNPYRFDQQNHQAFKVMKLPNSILHILWDFNYLENAQMNKYIKKMLSEISQDLKGIEYVEVICNIQNYLNEGNNFGTTSLRDIERIRLLYIWFKRNLPHEKSSLPLPEKIKTNYENRFLRSYIMTLSLNYYSRFNSWEKRQRILSIISKLIKKDFFQQVKKFEEKDFCQRLHFKYSGIAINESLRENIYCCFVSIMNRIPAIIIGDPGCSKSLSARILRDNFIQKEVKNIESRDPWLNSFSNIVDYTFQGSENCESSSVQKLFKKVHEFNEKNKNKNLIPLIVFDEIGLAEKSPDNPLKVIHEPLQINYNNDQRKLAFIGISNSELDISKMSRFMVIKRPKPGENDLFETGKQISKEILKTYQMPSSFIEEELKNLTRSYLYFIQSWKTRQNTNLQDYFGLRDYYNLIKEFSHQIGKNKVQNNDQNSIHQAVNISVFRNFNGFNKDYKMYLKHFYGKEAEVHFDMINEMMVTLAETSRRYPLILVPNSIVQQILTGLMSQKFKESTVLVGSLFEEDKRNEKYIIKSLFNFIKAAEKETLLIASSMNSVVETTLYDLFNKFYIKRAGNFMYRVSLESGLLIPAKVHPEFNCTIIAKKNQFSKMEAAFLNRFEKYNITAEDLDSDDCKRLKTRIQDFFNEIEKVCKENALEHYARHNLFLNCSSLCIKSLIWYSLLNNPAYSLEKHEDYCVERILLVCTKDFQYIFQKIIVPQNLLIAETIKKIKQTLRKKQEILRREPSAIFITTDSSLWRKQSKDTKVVKLELYKQEEELETDFNEFFENQKTMIEVDFIRTEGGNMCDSLDSRIVEDPNKKQNLVEVNYIIELLQKCRKFKALESRCKVSKKVRLIIQVDRSIKAEFPEISFMSNYPVYSNQGENFEGETSRKGNLFSNLAISPFTKEIFSKIQWDFSENPILIGCKQTFMKQCLRRLENDGSLFSSLCKDCIGVLEGKNLQIEEENIIEQLKNPENLKKFRNIQRAIALGFFKSKVSFPIKIFIEGINDQGLLMNTNHEVLSQFLSKIYNINCFNKANFNEFVPGYNQYLNKMLKSLCDKYFQTFKTSQSFRVKKSNRDYIPKIQIKKPTFFPLSDKIFTKVSASKQLQAHLTKENTNEKEFKAVFNKICEQILKGEAYTSFKLLSEQWKNMLVLDYIIFFLQQNGIQIRNALYFYDIFINFTSKYSFEIKIAVLMSDPPFWASIFKILDVLNDNWIFLKIQGEIDFKLLYNQRMLQLWEKINAQLHQKLQLKESSISSIKGQNKLFVFFKIYSVVSQEISNLKHLDKIKKNQASYLIFVNQFINLWESYSKKNSSANLSILLKSLERCKKQNESLNEIFKFLKKEIQVNLESASMINQFFGNKLFFFWIQNSEKKQRQQAIRIMAEEANQSSHFTHNIIGCIVFLFEILRLDYSKDLAANINNLNQCKSQQVSTLEQCLVSTSCNLSLLISNIFLRNMQLNNWVSPTDESLFAKYKDFSDAARSISQSSGFKFLFYLAFCKIYLFNYIAAPFKAGSNIFGKIDQVLQDRSIKITGDMKLYCLKLMRKKMRTKQIYEDFIKIKKYGWAVAFDEDIVQKQSRQIYVPKDRPNANPALVQNCKKYSESEGSETAFLELAFSEIKDEYFTRYSLLNFVMKYLYSMSYTKEYESKIKACVIGKKQEIDSKLGTLEAETVLRMTQSKFDNNLSLKTSEEFQETHFVILNAMNWMLSIKKQKTPFTDLFFKDGHILTSPQIANKLKNSFLPCGPENPFISIAKSVHTDTFNSNIGVYLCCNNCDFIYSHLNCGWPSETRDCPMCYKKIGSQRGHKLARIQEGARRLISTKVIDNSSFWVGTLKNLEEYWPAQRFYIQAEINRMRKKNKATFLNKDKQVQQIQLRGYNLGNNHERTSVSTAKIINLFIECNMYWLVSLDCIKQPQLIDLYNSNDKVSILNQLFKKIEKYIEDLKEAVGCEDKIYPWLFGIQQKVYELTMTFEKQFSGYVKKKEKESLDLAARLSNKVPSIKNSQHKDLYIDLESVIKGGLILKEFREVETAKDMTFNNQFCRQVFEEGVEEIVQKYLYDDKLKFIEQCEQRQGKPQFQFEPIMTESKVILTRFPSSYEFKVIPLQNMNSESIFTKYELIIKQDYPVINYVLTNISEFNALNNFYTVVSFINKLMDKANFTISRAMSSNITLSEFWDNKKEIDAFLSSWRKINKYMGPVQVDCKIYGNMNDELNQNSPVINFLLDTTSKENANGKIVSGIFHNYAAKHNQILNSIKTAKNRIAKFKNINLFLDNIQKNPQHQCKTFSLREEDINREIIEVSILSVVYGDSSFYHNFDLFQTNLLEKMKGMHELDKETSHYQSVMYVGQLFSLDAPEEYSSSIGQLRQQIYEPIPEQSKQSITNEIIRLQGENLSGLIKLKGLVQLLIYEVSKKTAQKIKLESVYSFITEKDQQNPKIDIEVWQELENDGTLKIENLVPLYELIEEKMEAITLRDLPEKYKKKIPEASLGEIKQYVRSLKRDMPEGQPSIREIKIAILRLLSRNCLSGTFQQETKKIFENICYKEDVWRVGIDIYVDLATLSGQTQALDLPAQYISQLIQIFNEYI